MKKILLLIVCFVLFKTGIVFAEVLKNSTFELGSEIYYFQYEEPSVMEDKGPFYGVTGSYAYHNKIMMQLEGRFAYGQVDYSSANTGNLDNIDDYVFEIRGLLGYDYKTAETFTITPYAGFGYRYLNDDSSGMTTTTGALGYERESNYYYSPIGVEIMKKLHNGWSVGGIFEYDIFWQGRQKSNLSSAVAGYNDLSNDQNDGYGLRGSIKIKKSEKELDFIIEPFIRYWNIKQSDTTNVSYQGVIIGYGYEPKNNTTEIGIKLALDF